MAAFPLFAANDCVTIRNLAANDVQTGEPVTITWSYQGGAPLSQMITGHDFAEPVLVPAGQTSYTYLPSLPGEKHAQLSAVTACGTVSASVQYHVKRCPIPEPVLTVDQTTVAPGGIINATLALQPGLDVRWEVANGTPSSTSGSA
ncbi:MAG: hypothetical protein ACLGH0_01860, partial [Thermoanaerobaculia bacterium]